MHRMVIGLCALLLTACVSITPMAPESAKNLKNSKVVVAFFDGVEQINYREDVYLVLAVAQVASNSVYSGHWDSNKDISAIHVSELGKLGIRAVSLYDSISDPERVELNGVQKDMYAAYTGANKTKDASLLNPRFRDLMVEKGNDYLIWITWLGYQFHMRTLGLQPMESYTSAFWIFDLRRNEVAWFGSISSLGTVSTEGQTGKAFLEKDDLGGLKARVAFMIKERYRTRVSAGITRDGLGKLMGLESKDQ